MTRYRRGCSAPSYLDGGLPARRRSISGMAERRLGINLTVEGAHALSRETVTHGTGRRVEGGRASNRYRRKCSAPLQITAAQVHRNASPFMLLAQQRTARNICHFIV